MKEGSDQNNNSYKLFENQLEEFNQKHILPQIGKYKVWAFYGNLGAGKTTLIKEICRSLGIDKNAVNSPTFALVNTYTMLNNEKVHHFDFYRIEHENEALDMGVDEYFYDGDLCLVEWPENVESLLPEDTAKIRIFHDEKAHARTYIIELP